MSWASMALELSGSTPVPYPFALTLIQRAWLDIQDSFLWSFLWGDAAIPTPVPTAAGTVTTTIGSALVVGDATASAAWAALPIGPLAITLQQFRVGQGTIYSIIAYDGVSTITLNQPYVDPSQGAGIGYQIYGVYYNAPVANFLWWETFTDPISGYPISTTFARETQMMLDPQRFQAGWPKAVLPYKINTTPGNFLGYPMVEIWPAPLNGYTYIGTYFCSAAPFVNLTDTVNPMLGEDVVLAQAKYRVYEWMLLNPDKIAHAPGSSYRTALAPQFLMGAATQEKKDLLNKYILKDEEFSHRHNLPDMPSELWAALPWVSMKAGIQYAP